MTDPTKLTRPAEDILFGVYLAGISNGLHRDITDPEEIAHRRAGFLKANPLSKKAKAALSTLVDEVIGRDEFDDGGSVATIYIRNKLRAEQRQRKRELMGE